MRLDSETRNIVVIGASAGGVEALTALFKALPRDLPAAFLVVLHVPSHTPSVLHRVLGLASSMPVLPAKDGQLLEAATVYVANADRHLMLDGNGIRVTRGPKECRVRPAVDVLFRSAALTHGARTIGVLLTGALDDGTAGSWVIKDRGGLLLVQDPSDAMQGSMPQSAIEHVEVDFVGTIGALARRLGELIGTPVAIQPERSDSGRHEIENVIAIKGNGIEAGVMGLGKVSKYTCPDCHGVLVQIDEGPIVRFRCHTGHAFSMKSLIAEVNAAIDNGLWDTLRAVEERVLLLRQMADLAQRSGFPEDAANCRVQAADAQKRLEPLRELVLDSNFFGHDQAR
ncbi:chemotaxis protein CheB [Stutzerimonas azotifigens]|uniref:protein-glutamate methylesterase n=1 Tax=Stutzerimonas azotifigens TaxID=291995 RepID=A0ABR5Z1E6_9GAMM|nr:chemotaxis protein CheB [Stutzerimonas azotifigens]MBA1274033.1 chemotaxis protein CheB [Stutzerimonas azotifigens]